MIKVTILYPNKPGAHFDFDYYLNVHMPLSIKLLGPAMQSVTVERGVSPGAPWPDHAFAAICSFVCESQEAYELAFFPHMEQLQGDIPNYTNAEAIIQLSEIKIDYVGANKVTA